MFCKNIQSLMLYLISSWILSGRPNPRASEEKALRFKTIQSVPITFSAKQQKLKSISTLHATTSIIWNDLQIGGSGGEVLDSSHLFSHHRLPVTALLALRVGRAGGAEGAYLFLHACVDVEGQDTPPKHASLACRLFWEIADTGKAPEREYVMLL